MNRSQKRAIMKKIPGYKNVLKEATEKAVNDLEKTFQSQWEKKDSPPQRDETLNNGERDYLEDNGEDDIYND